MLSASATWYRSRNESASVSPSVKRAIRNWLMDRLPQPDVRGKTIVMYSRRTFPKVTWSGLHSEFHGFFSEFHSVLGALAYAAARGAPPCASISAARSTSTRIAARTGGPISSRMPSSRSIARERTATQRCLSIAS